MPVVVDRGGSAATSLRRVGRGVVLVELRGVLTWPAAANLMRKAESRGVFKDARGLILDYRRAVMAMSSAQVVDGQTDGPMSLPWGLVSSEPDLPASRTYALAGAKKGLWRRTFLDTGGAYAWICSVLDERSPLDMGD